MNSIDDIIKAKNFLIEKGYDLNTNFKPFKVAELMAEYKFNDIIECHFTMSVSENINKQMDDIIIEGLKRKGFEFKNKYDLAEFIKSNCRCVENIQLKEKIYYVNDIPFFMHRYKLNIDIKTVVENGVTNFISTLGEFSYL